MSPRTETFYKYAGEIAQDLDTPILASIERAAPVCGRDQAAQLETFASADALGAVARMLRSGLKSVHVAGISGDVARDAVQVLLDNRFVHIPPRSRMLLGRSLRDCLVKFGRPEGAELLERVAKRWEDQQPRLASEMRAGAEELAATDGD